MVRYRWLRRCLPVAAGLGVLALIAPTTPASASASSSPSGSRSGAIQVIDVSNSRPQFASGGEALLEVKVPPAEHGPVQVLADGRDVTSVFARQADGTLLGLVTGLRQGDNTILARTAGTGGQAQGRSGLLHVVNHPITGPVFSGPQQTPFICQTQAFGLPPAVSPLCSAPTQVSYLYFNTAGQFVPLADPSSRPADLATATVNGKQVPYIVRLEQGTIDRAVYQVAALYDGRAPDPVQPDTSWNGKLVYTFGGGCDAGFHQGTSTGGVLEDLFLSQGYAVASSTLNVLQTNCSTIISAEAAMMVKEHFIDTYGPVRYTIGWGASGGAIQQYDIADAYPGILNGIIPGLSFPDPATTGGPVSDCRLLDDYFGYSGPTPGQSPSTVFNGFTVAQMTAVAGYSDYESCVSWDQAFANAVTATGSCDPSIPVSLLWNPVTNPNGVKCSLAEQFVNQLGVDPKTGFPRNPLDNVGVQYGLAALDRGQITPAQFAALNAGIGGYDVAGNHVAQRTEADPRALQAAYQDDVVLSGAQGLTKTPTIDMRDYADAAGFGLDIHTASWSFVTRQRLEQSGAAGNQVIIENSLDPATIAQVSEFELAQMDQWLNAITSDTSGRPLSVKVGSDKPTNLTDGCFLNGAYVHETLTYGGHGPCDTQFPAFSDPRLVAGEPLAENVLKCQLKPLDFRDYPVTFTPAEQAELRAAFPTGVCDYQRPGVGQQPPVGTWLNYGPGPGSQHPTG
jgi:hypothetical protein